MTGLGLNVHILHSHININIKHAFTLIPLIHTAVLFSKKTGYFVEYNAFYVTAIILHYTKNIYKICNCKPHGLKVNFLANTVV